MTVDEKALQRFTLDARHSCDYVTEPRLTITELRRIRKLKREVFDALIDALILDEPAAVRSLEAHSARNILAGIHPPLAGAVPLANRLEPLLLARCPRREILKSFFGNYSRDFIHVLRHL